MAKKKDSLYSSLGFKLLTVTTIVSLMLLGVKNLAQNTQNTNVLGDSTFVTENETEHNSQAEVQEPTDTPEPAEIHNENEVKSEINMEALNKVEFQSENGKREIHLQQGNSSIEISSEDGHLSVKAKNADGTEVQLQENALDKINEALKDEDVEIATTSGNGFLIRKGQFEAQTHFPLSINPTTNALTVTTPAGVKTVAILPDVAVNNLLRQKYIDEVASSSANTGIVLGVMNNQPAFQINGVDNKKLLGFISVAIDKTAFVSAQNGQVLKIDESFLSKLLDLLSVQ